MKRIVRLTESDLTRIVRRIVSEAAVATDAMKAQAQKSGNNWVDVGIASNIYNAKGYIYDDPEMAADALSNIKDKAQYYRVRNPKLVAMRPKDMPYNGFLPTNKRFQ